MFTLDVSPAADGAANLLSVIFLLQYVNYNVALGTEGGHRPTKDGVTRLNCLALKKVMVAVGCSWENCDNSLLLGVF